VQRVECECEMEETSGFWIAGFDVRHGDDGDAVVLIVVGEEGEGTGFVASVC